MKKHFGFPYFNIGRKYICFFGIFESNIFNTKGDMLLAIENKKKTDKIYEIEVRYRFIFMKSDFDFDQTINLLRLKKEEIENIDKLFTL